MESEYSIEEFKVLHEEINLIQSSYIAAIQYSLLIVAIVFSWLFTNTIEIVPEGSSAEVLPICGKINGRLVSELWLLPMVIWFVVLVFAIVAHARIYIIGGYLRKLENLFPLDHPRWEKFHTEGRKLFRYGAMLATLLGWCVVGGFILLVSNQIGSLDKPLPTCASAKSAAKAAELASSAPAKASQF